LYSTLFHRRSISNPLWIDVCQCHQSRGDLDYICDLNSVTKWSSESLKIITYDGVIFGSLSVKMFFVVSIWFCIDFFKIFIIFAHIPLVCTKFDDLLCFCIHACWITHQVSLIHKIAIMFMIIFFCDQYMDYIFSLTNLWIIFFLVFFLLPHTFYCPAFYWLVVFSCFWIISNIFSEVFVETFCITTLIFPNLFNCQIVRTLVSGLPGQGPSKGFRPQFWGQKRPNFLVINI